VNTDQSSIVRATSPEEAIALYTARLNDGDVDGLMQLYDDDASFSPEPGTAVTGPEAIREAVMGFTAMQPSVNSKVAWVQQVGSFALVLNDWSLEGQADGAPVTMSGRSADILHRGADGGWRFYVDCVWAGG
jgi:uncharacterized protein (TIGR02246 family)